jgi:DNA-binding NtrC family response regulator
MKSRILFVSGHSEDAPRLSRMLQPLPLLMDYVETLQQARFKLAVDDYDAILTEAALPDGEWRDALRLARECSREVEVVVTDPQADGRFWAEALGLGAFDLLAQPFYAPEVRRILGRACSREERRPVLRATG